MIWKWELLLTNLTQIKIMVWKVANSDYNLNQSINSFFGLKRLETVKTVGSVPLSPR